MKLAWSNARALTVAAALVVVSNAVALGGVAYNRSGEPDSVLQLTEREIPIQFWSWPDTESSAVHLELNWRVTFQDEDRYFGIEWLTADKLRELGFEVPAAGATIEEMQRFTRRPAREVFLALEYDGAAYRTMLERARARLRKAEANLAAASSEEHLATVRGAKALVEDEEYRSSRLFVVAADLDADALRKRYPDRQHYAIVRGRVDISMSGQTVAARIDGIDADTIRVPHAYRTVVEPYARDRSYARREPRYAAAVHFGRRHEPWIVQLSRT